jgi:hypothetical protein
MDLHRLFRPEGPWLHVLLSTEEAAGSLVSDLNRSPDRRVVARVVRGHKAITTAALFDEFAAALQLPYYFGENWDAFDECLVDLEWLPADALVVLIDRAARLLEKEPAEEWQTFVRILERAGREWAKPVSGEWARPPRPFHVLFQVTSDDEKVVGNRLHEAKVAFVRSTQLTGPSLSP